MVKCKYEGTGIWDGRCIGTKEVDPCHGYDKCKQYKPNYTTNADRIRNMTDEELKKFICSMFKCEFCDFELGERCGLLNWLQMPLGIQQAVDEQPTVDAVPVVRCKDCKHWHKDTVFCGYMPYGEASERVNWYADDFCSYGERKENK